MQGSFSVMHATACVIAIAPHRHIFRSHISALSVFLQISRAGSRDAMPRMRSAPICLLKDEKAAPVQILPSTATLPTVIRQFQLNTTSHHD